MTSDNEDARLGRRSETGEKQAGRPGVNVAEWADVYESAELWVSWNARRQWPTFTCNDQIWACSVTSWDRSGRRAAA